MIDTVGFLEIVLKRLIKGARGMETDTTIDAVWTKEEVMGSYFALSRLLNIAEVHDLLDDIRNDYLRNFIREFLVEFPKISEQQSKGFFNKNGYDIIVGKDLPNYKEAVVFVALNGAYVALLQKEDGPDKIRIEFQVNLINTTAPYEVFLEALQAAKEEL